MIDQSIENINNVICRHLDESDQKGRGFISQDILAQLRNFVECIMLKIYAKGNNIECTYSNICASIRFIESHSQYKDIRKFHDFLQIVASHYTMDEESSERLMLKYYEYLLKLKLFLKEEYSMDVLDNLEKFPLNLDETLQCYYQKIAAKLKQRDKHSIGKTDRYYIVKKKPFFVQDRIYYEVTFTTANDQKNKTNRVIAFTDFDLPDYYATKLTIVEDEIEEMGMVMPILLITHFEVSIRDCEFKNFINIVTGKRKYIGKREKYNLLKYLTNTKSNLVDFVTLPDEIYLKLKEKILENEDVTNFMDALDFSRNIIINKKSGQNILRYILLRMNNVFIKDQFYYSPNKNLSSLYLRNGCIPFDNMPFVFFPIRHTIHLSDIFECVDPKGREHELLARYIYDKTEKDRQIFTSLHELNNFNGITELVDRYNSALWSGHYNDRKLVIENNVIYINGYKQDTINIILELKKLTKLGINNYFNDVTLWLENHNNEIDCNEKKKAMLHMFEKSHVALIYGSAGTGKSTMINHIAKYFEDNSKLFLAQTNPAVDNLKRKVIVEQSYYSTISKFLSCQNMQREYDVLVIDECSTVSNKNMVQILNKAKFKILLLVGDIYQISSIRFGNWFTIIKEFLPETAVFELKTPYRTDNKGLITLWDRVRTNNDKILESLVKNDYSKGLDSSIFNVKNKDEVILCLNYDGLYGINNINRYLQANNSNKSFQWGVQYFKINDPILFNETNRFGAAIYNNMKGKIKNIKIEDSGFNEKIIFDIELEKHLSKNEIEESNIIVVNNEYDSTPHSIIRFSVDKYGSFDDDVVDNSRKIIPFQIAYAVSIHKAQGLEYESVKIIITDEVDELINHNIFYTAITRTRKNLKIYWTPEVENRVISSFELVNCNKDINLLKMYISKCEN